VTPVANTWLHCGPHLAEQLDAGLTRDPGREDRAPLRRPAHRRRPRRLDIVTPVAKTGLHCGGGNTFAGWKVGTVTPVAKTGLHCGGGNTFAGWKVGTVTPVAKTGLHCGRIDSHTDAV